MVLKSLASIGRFAKKTLQNGLGSLSKTFHAGSSLIGSIRSTVNDLYTRALNIPYIGTLASELSHSPLVSKASGILDSFDEAFNLGHAITEGGRRIIDDPFSIVDGDIGRLYDNMLDAVPSVMLDIAV